VAGKRHHYAPGLLLRRFAEASGKREGLVWRLDKVSGQPRPVAPKYEAALPHYYRLEHPDGTTDSRPEDLLASIENATGPILQRLERGQKPTDAERAWLALFVVLQHRRTPVARGWLNFLDEFASTLMTEVSLANRESFHRRAQSAEPNMTFEEVEEMRLELLADLQSGRATIGSTPSREVAAMFVAADKVAEDLVAKFAWGVIRTPGAKEFVLPDMGITMYDPTPRMPASGLGFGSSPNTETVLPVDPSFAIALTPGPPVWDDAGVDGAAVDELNLRAYAWSSAAVYGQSQKVVTDIRRLACQKREMVGRFKPRPGRLWIAEGDEEKRVGEIEFVGHSPDGTARQRFMVDPRAYDEGESFRG
jgi:hypothetical protein